MTDQENKPRADLTFSLNQIIMMVLAVLLISALLVVFQDHSGPRNSDAIAASIAEMVSGADQMAEAEPVATEVPGTNVTILSQKLTTPTLTLSNMTPKACANTLMSLSELSDASVWMRKEGELFRITGGASTMYLCSFVEGELVLEFRPG